MIYAKIVDGAVVAYPVYEDAIKQLYYNVSFSTPFVPPEGYVLVHGVSQPQITFLENLSEGSPQNVDAEWFQTWIVTPASEGEINERVSNQWLHVRQQRNLKLSASDWTQLPDAPVVKEEWVVYRQALRDVTNQEDPFNIVWPNPPQ